MFVLSEGNTILSTYHRSWKPEGWEDCSQTCNGGNRTREIKCMQVAADGIEYDVDSRLCSDPKPSMVEACNNVPCPPEWVAQPFGQVFIRFFIA